MIGTTLRGRRRRMAGQNWMKPLNKARRKKANIIVGALFSLCFTTVQSRTNPRMPDHTVITEWACLKAKDGITLCERWLELTNSIKVRERQGIMLVNCSIDAAVGYLCQSGTITDWMSAVETIEPLDKSAVGQELVHIVLGLPWPFDNRDIIGRYEIINLDEKHQIVQIYSEKGVDEVPDFVRIKEYCASWLLEEVGANETKVVFTTFSNERPLFPLWIQDPVVKKVYYSNLSSLKQHLSALEK